MMHQFQSQRATEIWKSLVALNITFSLIFERYFKQRLDIP
jgi:hypothetical protein